MVAYRNILVPLRARVRDGSNGLALMMGLYLAKYVFYVDIIVFANTSDLAEEKKKRET